MVVIGGPRRLLAACMLAMLSLALTALGLRLDWGLAWLAWVPAAALLLPALALAQRRAIERAGDRLEVTDGWCFRRTTVWPLAGAELELAPAGGGWAVVLHRGGRELVLASWLSRATAERLAALLSDLPRRPPRRPAGDR